MAIDGKVKTKDERTVATEQAEFGWHDLSADADTYGNGNGVQPTGFKYSGIRAISGAAVVEFINERGVDDDSREFITEGDGALSEAPFDQGSYEPGLFSSVTVTTGVIRCYIAYETPEL